MFDNKNSNRSKIAKFGIMALVALFSFPVMAARILPTKIQQVSTPGSQKIKVNGRDFTKTSSVVEYQYGKVKLTSPTKRGDTLVLDLDPSAVGFSIVLFTEKTNYGYIFTLVDPIKNSVIALKPKGVSKDQTNLLEVSGRGQMLSPNAALPDRYKEISITPVPNSDLVKVIPGRWTFSVGIEKNQQGAQLSDVRVSVFVKKAKAINNKTIGQLTIDTYSTIESEVSNLEDMEQYLAGEDYFFEKIGIQLSFRDHRIIDSNYNSACNDTNLKCFQKMAELMSTRSTEARTPGVLKAFFLKRNNDSDNGSANYGGSVSSLFKNTRDMFDGIFVYADPTLGHWQKSILRTFFHELGHHLGLYHTGEDNISDTRDINHWIMGNQSPKIENIMAARPGPGPFTKGQRYVLYRSVAVELYEPN